MLKILILNSRLSVAPWFAERLLTIQEDHMDLPGIFPLKAVGQQEDQYGKVVPFYTPDCMRAVRKMVKPGQYHAIIFCFDAAPYEPKIGETGGYTTPDDDVYLGTWLCTVRLDGNEQTYATHEIMHTFTHKLDRMGIMVDDIMDLTPVRQPDGTIKMIPYYKNYAPNDPDSNYARQWVIIAPHLLQLQQPTPVLKYGQKSYWVGMYQTQLEQLGYSFPAYGYFGPLTRRYVMDLQSRNGLAADGVVGPLTLAVSVPK